MARESVATKVYIASAAPAIRYNHIYGIDLTDNKNLIAYQKTDDEVAKALGCDKRIYQKLEDLIDCCKTDDIKQFEDGVFTGNYVTGGENGYLNELAELRAHCDSLPTEGKAEVDIGLYNIGDY